MLVQDNLKNIFSIESNLLFNLCQLLIIFGTKNNNKRINSKVVLIFSLIKKERYGFIESINGPFN